MTGLAPALCVGEFLLYRAASPEPPATLFLSHNFGDQPMSSSTVAASISYLGLDVHKDSVTIAVLPANATAPTRIDTYPYDFAKLRRVVDRLARDGEIRACDEASGAGPRCRAVPRDPATRGRQVAARHAQVSRAARLHLSRGSPFGGRRITSGCVSSRARPHHSPPRIGSSWGNTSPCWRTNGRGVTPWISTSRTLR